MLVHTKFREVTGYSESANIAIIFCVAASGVINVVFSLESISVISDLVLNNHAFASLRVIISYDESYYCC